MPAAGHDTNLTIDQAMQLALQFLSVNRFADAEVICRKVLAVDPNHPAATHLLGIAMHKQHRHEESIALLRRSVELTPTADFYNNLGEICRTVGRLDEALNALTRAVDLDPTTVAQQNNLGLVYLDKKDPIRAEAPLRRAVELDSTNANSLSNLAVALLEQERYEEVEAILRRAIELDPNHSIAHTNLANYLSAKGQLTDAEQAADDAVRLNPANPRSHLSRCAVLMFTGRLVEGWDDYEYRTARLPKRPVRLQSAPWDGSPLDGKTILLHAEQGFGDTIHFVRYVPLVAERGGKVIVQCQPELVDLMRTVKGVDKVLPQSPTLPKFDVHCPLLSLARVFRTDLTSIPNDVPYLHADEARVAHWKQRLSSIATPLRVGLAWAGNPTHERDAQRSCNLSDLSELATVDGVTFVSLQKGARAEQADEPGAIKLLNVANDLQDFSDTAALMANLDLIITVDTAAAHLAGALARPVWLMLPWRPEWRWFRDRTDSPWYPTMKIFRQPQPKDWASVAHQVADALKGLATSASRDNA